MHGRATQRVHQTSRPLNQCRHVCVEKCPLTTRHVATRSRDSCGSERQCTCSQESRLLQRIRRDRDPEAERKVRSHPHSGPSRERTRAGWRRERDDQSNRALESATSTCSTRRGKRSACWSSSQPTARCTWSSVRRNKHVDDHEVTVEGGGKREKVKSDPHRAEERTYSCFLTGPTAGERA